jgi:hypothetical protein
MAISLQYWRNYVDGFVKISRKSEAMVESNRVLTFAFDVDCMVVNSHVQASMKDRSYKVMVSLVSMCFKVTMLTSVPLALGTAYSFIIPTVWLNATC